MRGPSLVELTGDDNSATSTVAEIRKSPKKHTWYTSTAISYIQQSMDEPCEVANPAGGQLNR